MPLRWVLLGGWQPAGGASPPPPTHTHTPPPPTTPTPPHVSHPTGAAAAQQQALDLYDDPKHYSKQGGEAGGPGAAAGCAWGHAAACWLAGGGEGCKRRACWDRFCRRPQRRDAPHPPTPCLYVSQPATPTHPRPHLSHPAAAAQQQQALDLYDDPKHYSKQGGEAGGPGAAAGCAWGHAAACWLAGGGEGCKRRACWDRFCRRPQRRDAPHPPTPCLYVSQPATPTHPRPHLSHPAAAAQQQQALDLYDDPKHYSKQGGEAGGPGAAAGCAWGHAAACWLAGGGEGCKRRACWDRFCRRPQRRDAPHPPTPCLYVSQPATPTHLAGQRGVGGWVGTRAGAGACMRMRMLRSTHAPPTCALDRPPPPPPPPPPRPPLLQAPSA